MPLTRPWIKAAAEVLAWSISELAAAGTLVDLEDLTLPNWRRNRLVAYRRGTCSGAAENTPGNPPNVRSVGGASLADADLEPVLRPGREASWPIPAQALLLPLSAVFSAGQPIGPGLGSTVTTKALQKVVAGANNSIPLATSVAAVAEAAASPKKPDGWWDRPVEPRSSVGDEAVAHLPRDDAAQRRRPSVEPPSLAWSSMGWGRYQRRDNLLHEPTRARYGRATGGNEGGVFAVDGERSSPKRSGGELPEWLASSKRVAELARPWCRGDDVERGRLPSLVSRDATER